MINLKEKSIEELTNLEVKCKEAQKSIFTDIANCKKDSPEYNLLKTDFEKYTKLVVEIEKEKKLRKENEEKKETLKKENTKTKKENEEKEKNESNDSKSEIENEKDYKEYKETYNKLVEELNTTKNPKILKTIAILGAEAFATALFWAKAPIFFALLVTGASTYHIYKRIKSKINYEKIKHDAKYLKKEIDKYENGGKKKLNVFTKTYNFVKSFIPTKVRNFFNFKKDKKTKSEISKTEGKIKNNVDSIENKITNKKEDTNKLKVEVEPEKENINRKKSDNTESKTTKEKINELKKAKEEIIDGVYGLKKEQIIQDRVNVREICNFYHTNNTNPSYAKTSKEKVMVKK